MNLNIPNHSILNPKDTCRWTVINAQGQVQHITGLVLEEGKFLFDRHPEQRLNGSEKEDVLVDLWLTHSFSSRLHLSCLCLRSPLNRGQS